MIEKRLAIATEIEKEILAGKYGWEGGLPAASELAQKREVSLNTIKNALALLEGKGLIEKRGTGYYVRIIPTEMTSYLPPAHLRIRGGEGFVRNIGSIRTRLLPDHLAKLVDHQREVIYRMLLSGEIVEGKEKPIQLTHRYYLFPLSKEDLDRMQRDARFDPLWSDPRFSKELISSEEVCARLPTEGERDLLSLPESSPTAILSVREEIRDHESILMIQEIALSPRSALLFKFPFVNRP
ncbi:GntR family transcriptional regulator [Thermogemmatispora onikobensis]|uniref:GntR family transcriptional regulator n=1 Tax=Thermogemmatispora onikobensis TaxID=732234 RepID=UPI000853027E|nr:GntR family transcriptional regulator [Thermogemmatispora onikobensis]